MIEESRIFIDSYRKHKMTKNEARVFIVSFNGLIEGIKLFDQAMKKISVDERQMIWAMIWTEMIENYGEIGDIK